MDTIYGPGFCPKCQQQLITVNDVITCIYCEAKKPVMENASTLNPSEEEIEKVLGESLDKSSKSSKTLDEAIKIMKTLPMPEDVRQFKQIKKIIGLMEQLITRS